MIRTESVASIGVGSAFVKDEYNLVSFGPNMGMSFPRNQGVGSRVTNNSGQFSHLVRRTGKEESECDDEIIRLPSGDDNEELSVNNNSKVLPAAQAEGRGLK